MFTPWTQGGDNSNIKKKQTVKKQSKKLIFKFLFQSFPPPKTILQPRTFKFVQRPHVATQSRWSRMNFVCAYSDVINLTAVCRCAVNQSHKIMRNVKQKKREEEYNSAMPSMGSLAQSWNSFFTAHIIFLLLLVFKNYIPNESSKNGLFIKF